MVRCHYCDNLSISKLINLAKKEFWAGRMARQAFYQHHGSLEDLEESANLGCDFCTLILQCLKGTPWYRFPFETIYNSDIPMDGSLYGYAKDKLSVTDIKICISSSHVFPGTPFNEVRVFDLLYVQVEPSSSDDHEWNLEPAELAITIPLGERIFIEGFRVGRFQLDSNLGSQANHGIAKSWLSTCREQHESCLRCDAAELPTRVVDIGADNHAEVVRIIPSEGKIAPYVALSHCWGGKISPLLTSKTLDQYQQRLPVCDLAANFRDAIIITRQLGIRYLWIDSLCILQDSKPDWEQESKKMGLVYRNSAVTISALSSERSTQGILRSHGNLQKWPSVTMKVYEDNENRQVTVEGLTQNHHECLQGLSLQCPLNIRGWTLQESLLSPRHLYYGVHKIYWSCPGGFESADGLPAGARTPPPIDPVVSSTLHGEILAQTRGEMRNLEDLLVAYYELVMTYTSRRLTYDSDKLPAFSGVARLINTVLHGEYLAGLWSFDFNRGLSWHSGISITARHVTARHVHSYRAPSWSWAITNEPVHYFSEARYKSDIFALQLLEHDTRLRDPSNPYGEVTAGSVIVNGFTKLLIRSKQVINGALLTKGGEIGIGHFDEPLEGASIYSTQLDLYSITTGESNYLFAPCLGWWRDEDRGICREENVSDEFICLIIGNLDSEESLPETKCLILRKVASTNDDEFERAGFLTLEEPPLEWLEGWEPRRLRLL